MDIPNRREVLGIAAASSLTLILNQPSAAVKPLSKSAKEPDMRELDAKTLQDMAARAKVISEKAYCPYSKFPVGAVVLSDDGQMFDGCNVENASYGLTICAERNAIFQMVAHSKQKIAAIVIYTATPTPAAPCGACRQVVNEFGPQSLVMSVCDGPEILKKRLPDLLPDAFGPTNLE